MTVPLTPNDPPPPHPYGGPEPQPKARAWREVVIGLLVVVLMAVAGLLVGLLWLKLAPRVPLISDGKAVYLQDSEGEQAIGADGWFVLLGLAAGLLCALVAFWRRRSGGIAMAVGLALGGVAASVIAWRFGVALGPTTNVLRHAKQAGPNTPFAAPLVLHSKGALMAWPIGGVLGYIALLSIFTSEPAPAWPGWTHPDGPQPASGAHWVSYTPSAPATGQDGGDGENGNAGNGGGGNGGRPGDDDTPGKGDGGPRG